MHNKAKLLIILVVALGIFAGSFSLVLADSHEFDWRQFEGETIVVSFPAHKAYNHWVDMLPKFEEKTGIEVQVDQMNYGKMSTTQTLEMSKPNGDYDLISMVGPLSKAKYAQAGYLEPLGPMMENESISYPDWDFDDFVDKLVTTQGKVCLTCKGKNIYLGGGEGSDTKLYAVPASSEVSVFAYRKDLFEEYGLVEPKTFEDVLELSEFFAKNVDGVYGLTMRGKAGHQAGHGTLNLLKPFGGEIFTEDWEPAFTSENALDTLRYFKKIVEYGPPGIPSFGAGGNDNAFLQGKAAMYLDHSRIASLVRDPEQSKVKGKVAYTTIPKRKGIEDTTVAETGGFGIAIPANAGETDKKAAFLLMQWMTSKKVERELMTEYGVQIVDRESLMKEPELQEQFPEYKVMANQVKLADPAWRPAIPEWPEIETEYFGVAVNKVLTGRKEPEKAMQDIVKPVREIMEEAGYYE